ncbi:MAG: DNA polymerase III subunit gamma/tau [Thermoanaerobaculia bacterium]
MSYQALARKYRPQSFRDIIGQETVVRTLQNAIEQQRIHHAYLFSGVRGVGKTTAARVLAKALNCATGPTLEPCNECTACREITEGIDLDVREIDAATYTGVDNVRELRDVSQFQPARDRYRIFIVDEAHMLSAPAWNALLKLIEEPPPHVIFMFATTEIHKVPQTILSRVQKFMLRKITLHELVERLSQISEAEGIVADRGALEIVARRGEGSVRDALSLLDQIIAFSGRSVSAADVATILGLSDSTFFARIVSYVGDGDHAAILGALQEAADSGRDFRMLYRDLLNFFRNLLLIAGGAEAMVASSPEDLAAMRDIAGQFSYSDLLRIANLLLRDDETVNRAEHQRLAVELAILKAATFPRLKAVEQVLAGGGLTTTAGSSQPRQQVSSKTQAAPRQERPTPPAERSAPVSSREPAVPAAAPEEPRRSAPASGGAADGAAALVERVQKQRPLIATYLTHAIEARMEGDRVVFLFSEPYYSESVADARSTLEDLAAEVYGRKVSVEAKLQVPEAAPQRRTEDRPSPLSDDPVLRSFQKHLGAEVVEPRKR